MGRSSARREEVSCRCDLLCDLFAGECELNIHSLFSCRFIKPGLGDFGDRYAFLHVVSFTTCAFAEVSLSLSQILYKQLRRRARSPTSIICTKLTGEL